MRTPYVASLFAGVILSLVYIFQASYTSLMSLVSNASFLVLSIATLSSATFALNKYWRDLRDKYSRIWLYLTAGLLLWFVSRVSWTVYAVLLNAEVPYPSIADAIWLAGYVPIFVAMHTYLRSFGFSFSKMRYAAFAVAISIVLLSCFVLLVPPIVASSEKEVTALLSVVYLGLDLSLFSLSMHGLFVFAHGKIGLTWAFISVGLFLNAVGDILFSYAVQNNVYYNGHVLELLFHTSYILCILAFYAHTKEL